MPTNDVYRVGRSSWAYYRICACLVSCRIVYASRHAAVGLQAHSSLLLRQPQPPCSRACLALPWITTVGRRAGLQACNGTESTLSQCLPAGQAIGQPLYPGCNTTRVGGAAWHVACLSPTVIMASLHAACAVVPTCIGWQCMRGRAARGGGGWGGCGGQRRVPAGFGFTCLHLIW